MTAPAQHLSNQQPPRYPERDTDHIPHSSDILWTGRHDRSAGDHHRVGAADLRRYP